MREVKPTQKPVPSSDIKDLFFNSGLLDIWATSLEHKYIDRFGNCHLTAAGMEWIFNELVIKFKIESEQALLAAGYAPAGTFQEGAEVVSRNGTVLWKLPDGDGEYYRWDGDLPKQVPAGSTPQSTGGIGKGAWVSVGDASLRSERVFTNRPAGLSLTDIISVKDFGAKGDGLTDDTLAFKDAIKFCKGSLYIPHGTYIISNIEVSNISIYGAGYNSSIIKTIATSGVVIKATNDSTANTNNRSIIKGIRVVGTNSHLNSETLIELDVPDEKYVGSIRVTECYLEKASGANIRLKAGTHCIVDNNEIWMAKGCGIELRSTSEFNNVAMIQYNRIKHNWMGIGASNFETMGVVNAPQNRSKAELSGVTIEYNLIEQNTNCNDDGSVWDYTDRLGTINRPGIGILLEGVYGAVIRRNWIEMYYQGIKLNGGNKFNTIEENTMGYTRFDAALQGTGKDMLAPLVLVSHGSGASTENAGNNINENYFVHANGYSGGKYFGDNIILAGQNNQSNTFYRNYKDGGDRTIKITSDTFSDKNILVNYHLDPTDLFVEINAKLSVTTLQSKNTILTPDSNTSITTLDGIDAGGAGLLNRLSFKSSKHNINRGNLTIGASNLSATDGSNNMCFVYGNSDPNGIGSLSVYDAGSIYMRKGVGLYVKESAAGTATGWMKK